MGSLISCLTGRNERAEVDDHSENDNRIHSQRHHFLRSCTHMLRTTRSISPSSDPVAFLSNSNQTAGILESDTSPVSPLLQNFPSGADSSNPCLEIVGTANQQGGTLDYKAKSKQSEDVSSVSVDEIESVDECPTCFEEYNDENPKIIAKCSHHYHLGCIYDWMERSKTCPACSRLMIFDEKA